MKRVGVGVGLLMVCSFAGVTQAQGSKTPVADTSRLTTLSGVYTAGQAARGKDVYAGSCRSCHAVQTHTGEIFETNWRGKPLADLFTFVSTRMPKNDPGSLAPEDVADVVAYLLQMNAMPTGKRELPPDTVALKSYRIEMKGRDSIAVRKEP